MFLFFLSLLPPINKRDDNERLSASACDSHHNGVEENVEETLMGRQTDGEEF